MTRFVPCLFLILMTILPAGFSGLAQAAAELRFWHSMEGEPAAAMQRLVERFNASQTAYRVVASHQGEDVLAAGLRAHREGKAPHLLQLPEAAAADMMAERAYQPIHQVAAQGRMRLDRNAYFPHAAALYSDSSGRLLALPVNSATPLMFYNRETFRNAGLDPDQPPATWYELQTTLLALQAAGEDCPYTTSWPAWVHMENVSAWHNFPFASADNGFSAARPQLLFNGHLMIRHVSLLSAWLKSGLFHYAGRREEARSRFSGGECAVLTDSSAAHAGIIGEAGFPLGVAPLPHYDDFKGAPYNTLAGGSALWAMAGKTAAEYTGVARFMQFLTSPEAVIEWHQTTGFMPVTHAAHASLEQTGWYELHPEMAIAVKQLRGHPTGPNGDKKGDEGQNARLGRKGAHGQQTHESRGRHGGHYGRGVRLRQFEKIRHILDEELEAVWKHGKAPKAALDEAVTRGNALLGKPAPRRP